MRATIKWAEMRLRARNTKTLRLAYRIARSFQLFVPSKTLPESLVRDCRFFSSRVSMLDHLPGAGRVAELDTYKGDFAREILSRNLPVESHLIDIDHAQFDRALAADPRA